MIWFIERELIPLALLGALVIAAARSYARRKYNVSDQSITMTHTCAVLMMLVKVILDHMQYDLELVRLLLGDTWWFGLPSSLAGIVVRGTLLLPYAGVVVAYHLYLDSYWPRCPRVEFEQMDLRNDHIIALIGLSAGLYGAVVLAVSFVMLDPLDRYHQKIISVELVVFALVLLSASHRFWVNFRLGRSRDLEELGGSSFSSLSKKDPDLSIELTVLYVRPRKFWNILEASQVVFFSESTGDTIYGYFYFLRGIPRLEEGMIVKIVNPVVFLTPLMTVWEFQQAENTRVEVLARRRNPAVVS